MTRQVAHGEKAKGGRVCECGATFKTNRLLRRHLAAAKPDREVWIGTPEPISMHRVRR